MAEPLPTSNRGSPTRNSASGNPDPDKKVGKESPNAQQRVREGLGAPNAEFRAGEPLPPAKEGRWGPGPQAVDDYVRRLSEEHKMLVALKAQLYGGSWEPMLDDLRNRLAGKPYIFKLVHRIQDDIERIEEMRKFEAEHEIDLAEYVDG
ncbi:MAG: hypothetical protein M1376_12815 [Planctomycetes bacterium]|nr:hypothetical protein [Planctomycetota bacterium]